MSLRRIRAIARKEFLHILRDPRSLGMALALPLVMILLFGYALSLDVDRIPTAVFDADGSPQSRELLSRFSGSRFFEVESSAARYDEIESRIASGACLIGIVIPRDYGRSVVAGRKSEVQLIIDGSDSNTASIALGYADAVFQRYVTDLRIEALEKRTGIELVVPVETRLRVWYNSGMESKNYLVPGLIAVILTIIAALLTSLTIAREWENGTMEQLLSTPARAPELVLGKMSAYFVLGLIDTILAILAGVFVFGVPLRGNVLFLGVSCGLFLIGALCWGILLSAIARSQLLAYQMGVLSSFLPAFLLSGFIYATENMPAVIQAISHITPSRYFVTVLKGIFLKGVGIEVLWVEILFLLVYAAIVFALATRRLKQKLA